jgi:hypothetical protein
MALIAQIEAHFPQPVHDSVLRSTDNFLQPCFSKANSRNSHAEMHRPHPEQRVVSIWAT